MVGTVLVQAADHDGDTEAMLAEAQEPLVLGVVGYLPLEQPAERPSGWPRWRATTHSSGCGT